MLNVSELGMKHLDVINYLSKSITEEKLRKCPSCRMLILKANIGKKPLIFIDICQLGSGQFFSGGEIADLIKQVLHQ